VTHGVLLTVLNSSRNLSGIFEFKKKKKPVGKVLTSFLSYFMKS
jgi:hypothetical protein